MYINMSDAKAPPRPTHRVDVVRGCGDEDHVHDFAVHQQLLLEALAEQVLGRFVVDRALDRRHDEDARALLERRRGNGGARRVRVAHAGQVHKHGARPQGIKLAAASTSQCDGDSSARAHRMRTALTMGQCWPPPSRTLLLST